MSLKLDGTGTITGIDQGLSVVGVGTFSTDLDIGGDLNVTGVVTYEDVTNIDSVGVITARSGVVGDLTGNVTGNVTGEYTLASISSSITDTAVDIFVYDTSKDSDGGAWRKRTQHTSWYNETLNTSTRGSRKEFPAVAVLVLASDTLTIYDGDDPNLPMWMVFPSNGYLSWASSAAPSLTSIHMLNGIFVTGASDGRSGLYTDFIKDDIRYLYNVQYYNPTDRTIRGRGVSVTGSGSAYSAGGDGFVIVDNAINDVAMTVLPNAPIDDATGLPVPTIAVATDGGVSVIKDDETVVDIVSSYGPTDNSDYVEFTKSGGLVLDMGHNGDRSWLHTFDVIPNSDTTVTVNTKNAASGSNPVGWYDVTDVFGADLIVLSDGQSDQIDTRTLYGDTIVATTGEGMTFIDEYTPSPSNGMVAYATTSYNTGWMHGDCKGAFLSDTDTTNLVEGDILGGKGTFDDASYWTAGSSWTVSGGVATSDSSGISYLTKNGILTTGERYVIKLTISSYSTGTLYVYCGTGAPGSANHYLDASANGTYTMILDAYNTNFGLYGANFGGVVDNVTISSVVDQDRSINGKNLGVIGTITKSAVATGADLVAYSGWSTSNYLEQPFNTDMNVGTGDFYVMGWIYPTSNTTGYVWEYAAPFDTSGYTEMFYHNSGVLRFYIQGGTPAEKSVSLNVWQHFVCVRRSGQIYLYVNGVSGSAVSDAAALSNTSAKLRIGIRAYDVAAPFYGKIALVRMGASAPLPEQIKKIYEDEKVLFQENAKCTLYGSSNNVTALGYDEDTELLHVGTSAGRSDFQGLRRINNTTTAVTTAISASDELIAEQ